MLSGAQNEEETGHDAVNLSEHHASEDGYLPSPLIAASAVAAVTSRVPITVWALIARYAVLLTKQATSLASFGFLELTAIALALASIGATAKAAVTAWGVEEEEDEEE